MSSFNREEEVPPKMPVTAAARIKKLVLEILLLRQSLNEIRYLRSLVCIFVNGIFYSQPAKRVNKIAFSENLVVSQFEIFNFLSFKTIFKAFLNLISQLKLFSRPLQLCAIHQLLSMGETWRRRKATLPLANRFLPRLESNKKIYQP